MPRSRTTSPIPGPDISRSFVPGLTLTHSNCSVDSNENYYSRTTNVTSSSNNSGQSQPARKKHKYVKPRIGSSFQAKVEPFDESIAKATIRGRQLELRCGISSVNGGSGSGESTSIGEGKEGGVIVKNDISFAGEEYGLNGGIFAAPLSFSSSSMNGYSSNNFKRKKAGRPAKNAKANKGKGIELFELN